MKHHFDPETKRQGMVWKHASSDTPKKFKVTPYAGKVRATVFGTVKVWWWQIICQKALLLQAHIMLLNRTWSTEKQASRKAACPHSAVAMSAVAECGYESLLHPPYSPDLAPSDLYLFPCAERTLKWHTFLNWQWRHCVCGGLSSGARWTLLQDGLQELQKRWNKFIEVGEDYVEK